MTTPGSCPGASSRPRTESADPIGGLDHGLLAVAEVAASLAVEAVPARQVAVGVGVGVGVELPTPRAGLATLGRCSLRETFLSAGTTAISRAVPVWSVLSARPSGGSFW
jgi:hypothetical protein